MSLKTDVLIRNQYTVKTAFGGSRGGTPGDYVLHYMARNDAIEDLTPVKLAELDDYVTRYMARDGAVESAGSVSELKSNMYAAQKLGGVAFGFGSASLSHERLIEVSKDIQAKFEDGKTVMKTVVSFTPEYLAGRGITPADFKCERRGDYRGNIDQLKLRMAIMNGLRKMSRHYDDLRYVGVIQVDTEHVHCHLAMVDYGRGTLAADGTQKGKLSSRAKSDLRRGIEDFLDEHQQVRMLSSNVNHDRRNTVCHVKRFTHRFMAQAGAPQFLLACLPEDEGLWRAGSNRKEMQKANHIVREYVTQVLAEPDSGYREALQAVDKYARTRQEREGLSDDEYRALYFNGREKIIRDGMNGVYSVLRQIPRAERQVQTPMLAAMSLDYDAMAGQADSDPMVEFGFKLRSYSSRLEFHKKERHKYKSVYEDLSSRPDTIEQARPVIDFFKFEAEYQEMLMCKYQHFLSFLPPSDEYEDDFNQLVKYRNRLFRMQSMRKDKSMRQMKPGNAESYGQEAYGLKGGRYVAEDPGVIDQRLVLMNRRFEMMRDELREKLSDFGLSLSEDAGQDGHGLAVSREKRYPFDEVKALDIHHLTYDFSHDIGISMVNIQRFRECAERRSALYSAAVGYLDSTGQSAFARMLPGRDVRGMKAMADALPGSPYLPVARPVDDGARGRRTVRLDVDYRRDIDLAIRQAVDLTVQMGRELD